MRERVRAWPLPIRVVIVVLGSLLVFIAGGVLLHVIDGSKHPWINAVYWGLILYGLFWVFEGTKLAASAIRSSVARACFLLCAFAIAVGIGVFLVTRSNLGGGVAAFLFAAYCLVQIHSFAASPAETSET